MELADSGLIGLMYFFGGFSVGVLLGVLSFALAYPCTPIWTLTKNDRIEDLDEPAPTSDWKDRKCHDR